LIRALMIDVDGVLVTGRPEDGENWAVDLEHDLGVRVVDLRREFFTPYWDEIIVGRAQLSECLALALARIAPNVRCEELISYWFERDSRLESAVLSDIAACRAAGIRVYLATNQEHMRVAYLMQVLGLAKHVNGIFYSAEMGCRKPERHFFQKIELRTGLDPREHLFIDDTLANVTAAKDAGWKAVHWTGESSLSTIIASERLK
jgi:putative hydrolase of the HAD superfamily